MRMRKPKRIEDLLWKKSESTCAVLPSRVFSISETPQHEFPGHLGEILDFSWSEKGVNFHFSGPSVSLLFIGNVVKMRLDDGTNNL